MDDETRKIIEEHLLESPEPVKGYLRSGKLNADIEQIVGAQPLQNVQKDAFHNEVMFVLLGMEPVDSFTVNIKHNMEIAMKRAEDISKQTKQIIFAPLMEYLVDKATALEGGEHNDSDGVRVATQPKNTPLTSASAGMQPKQNEMFRPASIPPAPKPKQSFTPEKPVTPTAPQAPATPPAAQTPQEAVLQKPAETHESLDIFKKRLEQPVHTPTEENQMGEEGKAVANVNPSSKEQIANDPYKETIE